MVLTDRAFCSSGSVKIDKLERTIFFGVKGAARLQGRPPCAMPGGNGQGHPADTYIFGKEQLN